MKYNQLGNTDLKVSHVGLGGAAFSNIYGAHEEERGVQLVRHSLKSGINYLETGPWYGQGSSEKTVGKREESDSSIPRLWHLRHELARGANHLRYGTVLYPEALKGIPRESYYIGSKVGRYEQATDKMFDFSAEKTDVMVDNTLRLLGLDYVDIIQIHDLSFSLDNSIILKETLPALERAVRDGKARYIGLADYDIDLMKEIVEESEVRISSVLSYAKSTLLDNQLHNYTGYFKSKGIGVINCAATGMGLLTNLGPKPWHPASEEIKAICRQAADFCKAQNVELARLASWFTLQQPGVDTNICGFYNCDQLRDTLQVMDEGLTEKETQILQELQTRFFNNGPLHWNGVEVPDYVAKLDSIRKQNQH